MKRTMIFTAIVLLSTAISAQTVSFGPAPQVTSWADTASSDSSLSVNGSKSANATASRTVSRSKTTCVVAADARGSIESVEVTYAAATRDGVGLPVAGRQYLVRRAVNGIVVTHADGTAPDAEETSFVAGDNTHFARFAAMQRIFAGKTFAVGTSFQLSPVDATELANLSDGSRVRNLALTLRSVVDGVATFDVSTTIDAERRMSVVLNGTLEVMVATSLPRRYQVAGAIRSAQVAGTAAMQIEYAF